MCRGIASRFLSGGAVLLLLILSPGLFAQPVNDFCIDAEIVELADGLGVSIAGTTADGASRDPESGGCGASTKEWRGLLPRHHREATSMPPDSAISTRPESACGPESKAEKKLESFPFSLPGLSTADSASTRGHC